MPSKSFDVDAYARGGNHFPMNIGPRTDNIDLGATSYSMPASSPVKQLVADTSNELDQQLLAMFNRKADQKAS